MSICKSQRDLMDRLIAYHSSIAELPHEVDVFCSVAPILIDEDCFRRVFAGRDVTHDRCGFLRVTDRFGVEYYCTIDAQCGSTIRLEAPLINRDQAAQEY